MITQGWPALADPQLFLPNTTNGGCAVPQGEPNGCKGDGCHPDDAGHHAIAVVVKKAIERSGLLLTPGRVALKVDDGQAHRPLVQADWTVSTSSSSQRKSRLDSTAERAAKDSGSVRDVWLWLVRCAVCYSTTINMFRII